VLASFSGSGQSDLFNKHSRHPSRGVQKIEGREITIKKKKKGLEKFQTGGRWHSIEYLYQIFGTRGGVGGGGVVFDLYTKKNAAATGA